MKSHNLSAWALKHPHMVFYLLAVILIGGVLSYLQLGRAEDPPFTFKVMVVRTLWPGATVREVETQLTEKIEKKLQETPNLDIIRSASRPGESMLFLTLKDSINPKEVPDSWYQVRKKLNDIKQTLPVGVVGPFPNDEFGDVDILIYGLTGDGFSLPELRRSAESMARELRTVADVKKVELVGVQDEKIYVEIAPARMAALGLTPAMVADALQKQNAVTPSGFIETDAYRVQIHVNGALDGVTSVENVMIAVAGKTLRLGDIAKISRGLVAPAATPMRIDGKPAIAIAIVAAKGANVAAMGDAAKSKMDSLKAALPAGIDVHEVANQPEVVKTSVELFVESLAEALIIVLAVSFLSLGWRTGTVVGLSIPLVLAMTFLAMKVFGVDLHRISLGALVIALGLLVDDAIIAVEMMVVKIEQGYDRFEAATFAYTSTAFPMLTGTLITAAGFLPVGFAKSAAGEYCFSIFAVVGLALIMSWLVAVFFTPFIGYRLLDVAKLKAIAQKHGTDIYDTPFYRRLRRVVEACLTHRWKVIAATVAAFVLSIVLFGTVIQQQFFPSSSRNELLVDVWLPQSSSLKATDIEMKKIEALIAKNENVASYFSYIGNGSPRFYLSLDQQLFSNNFGQLVIMSKNLQAREALKAMLDKHFDGSDTVFSHIRARTVRLENGPPVGYPVQFRVSGENADVVRGIASKVASIMRGFPALKDAHLDWDEKAKSIRVDMDQERARALGFSPQEVANAMQAWLNGAAFTQYREGDQLIDVTWRAAGGDRAMLDKLGELDIVSAAGRHVPLAQIAKLVPVQEESVIWRRDRLPTITVRADLSSDKTQAATVAAQIEKQLTDVRATLPAGYTVTMGGSIEESAKSQKSIMAMMPLMLLAVITLLLIQLQNIPRAIMVLLTAPLGLIGVALALLLFQAPFGFVANLGVIALMGMIMRNAVILIDQIEKDEAAGKTRWEAIVGSTVRRFRPIVLTAAAAILAMIPLTFQVFWGPMAVAIMGGLIVATALTCLFLPALYAAWFKVRREG